MSEDGYSIIDVRNQSEWERGRIPGAVHLMLGHLAERLDSESINKNIIVHCQSGARSAIGSSILKANGIKSVLNLTGGFKYNTFMFYF